MELTIIIWNELVCPAVALYGEELIGVAADKWCIR
jgi:hypothetical protein